MGPNSTVNWHLPVGTGIMRPTPLIASTFACWSLPQSDHVAYSLNGLLVVLPQLEAYTATCLSTCSVGIAALPEALTIALTDCHMPWL